MRGYLHDSQVHRRGSSVRNDCWRRYRRGVSGQRRCHGFDRLGRAQQLGLRNFLCRQGRAQKSNEARCRPRWLPIRRSASLLGWSGVGFGRRDEIYRLATTHQEPSNRPGCLPGLAMHQAAGSRSGRSQLFSSLPQVVVLRAVPEDPPLGRCPSLPRRSQHLRGHCADRWLARRLRRLRRVVHSGLRGRPVGLNGL